jgi:hypothetical protein
MSETAAVENHPELGIITIGCDVCAALRESAGALAAQTLLALDGADMECDDMQGAAHPNEFLAVYAERIKHEKTTGHTTFGWRFIREARKQAAAYATGDDVMAGFWRAFSERFLALPETEPV